MTFDSSETLRTKAPEVVSFERPAYAGEGIDVLPRKARAPRRRPQSEPVMIHLDIDVLTIFRATGRGWQARINGALRQWLGPPWTD